MRYFLSVLMGLLVALFVVGQAEAVHLSVPSTSLPDGNVEASPETSMIPLVLSEIRVTPQTLNLDSEGDGMSAVDLVVDENAPTTVPITIAGSVSDPDGIVTTAEVSIGHPEDGVPNQVVNINAQSGSFSLTFDVPVPSNIAANPLGKRNPQLKITDNDGNIVYVNAPGYYIIGESTANLGNGTYFLNGVENIAGGAETIVRIQFSRQEVIKTLSGVTVPGVAEMNLTGNAIGTDYIDVISKDSRGKSK